MRPYRSPPAGVMTPEEIRYWLKELLRRGWTAICLQRTLGAKRGIKQKMSGDAWIYPTEQVRFSKQLQRIISGELVQQAVDPNAPPCSHKSKRNAVLAEHPVPLSGPMTMVYDFRAGRLALRSTEPERKLPSFKSLLNDPPTSRTGAVDYRGMRRKV